MPGFGQDIVFKQLKNNYYQRKWRNRPTPPYAEAGELGISVELLWCKWWCLSPLLLGILTKYLDLENLWEQRSSGQRRRVLITQYQQKFKNKGICATA